MRFEWDEDKAASNLRKHRVSFDLASEVFKDRLARRFPDERSSDDDRWIILGSVDDLLLYVVFSDLGVSEGEHHVRIISARRATRHERRDYER